MSSSSSSNTRKYALSKVEDNEAYETSHGHEGQEIEQKESNEGENKDNKKDEARGIEEQKYTDESEKTDDTNETNDTPMNPEQLMAGELARMRIFWTQYTDTGRNKLNDEDTYYKFVETSLDSYFIDHVSGKNLLAQFRKDLFQMLVELNMHLPILDYTVSYLKDLKWYDEDGVVNNTLLQNIEYSLSFMHNFTDTDIDETKVVRKHPKYLRRLKVYLTEYWNGRPAEFGVSILL